MIRKLFYLFALSMTVQGLPTSMFLMGKNSNLVTNRQPISTPDEMLLQSLQQGGNERSPTFHIPMRQANVDGYFLQVPNKRSGIGMMVDVSDMVSKGSKPVEKPVAEGGKPALSSRIRISGK